MTVPQALHSEVLGVHTDPEGVLQGLGWREPGMHPLMPRYTWPSAHPVLQPGPGRVCSLHTQNTFELQLSLHRL